MVTNPTEAAMREAFEEDCQHLVDCLRGAILDSDETSLRALLSNNVNTIIHALKSAATQAHARAEMEARELTGDQVQQMVDVYREWSAQTPGLRDPNINGLMRRLYRATLAEPQSTGAGEG